LPHLSVATVIEKNKIASAVAFVPLLEIKIVDPITQELVETVYYANNPVAINFQGNTYLAAAFTFQKRTSSGSLGEMSLTVKDYTQALKQRMEAYGGGVGFEVKVLVINTGNLNQPPEIEELFSIISASTKGYDVQFTLGAENPLTVRFPRRMQNRDRCPWIYKGPECKYAGALPTCDYSLQGPNGCAAHNNTLNFGAFPGIRNGQQ
jgi:phage-related protein